MDDIGLTAALHHTPVKVCRSSELVWSCFTLHCRKTCTFGNRRPYVLQCYRCRHLKLVRDVPYRSIQHEIYAHKMQVGLYAGPQFQHYYSGVLTCASGDSQYASVRCTITPSRVTQPSAVNCYSCRYCYLYHRCRRQCQCRCR